MKYQAFIFTLVIVVWTACKSVQTVTPSASYSSYVHTPPISEVFIPIEISIPELEGMLNKQLQGVLYEDSDFSDDLLLKIEKVEPIRLRMNGDAIEYTVPIKLWTKAGYEFKQFGLSLKDVYEGDCSLRISFSTKIELNPFWELRPTTTLLSYEWIEKPTITKGHITIPIGFVADKLIKTQEKVITQSIDEQIKSQIPMRRYMEQAWTAMHQPIQFYDDPVTWLKITPKKILITPLTGTTTSLKAFVKIEAITETKVGKKPTVVQTNLPNVSYTNDHSGAFIITVLNGVDYEDASVVAAKYLKGETFSSPSGKKKVTVDSIRLFGKGEQLVIETHVSGALKGAIYFTGIPTYDSLRQVIYLKNLDYELQTKNVLAKSAGWLLKSILLKRMKEVMVYDIKSDMIAIRQSLDEALQSYALTPQVKISAKIQQMYPKTIFLTPESMSFVLFISGDMQVRVNGLDQ